MVLVSPCINVCVLKRGQCTGCGRSRNEISRWLGMTDRERSEIMMRLSGHPVEAPGQDVVENELGDP
ncbi:MAG: DUF1289 domain-containing protein [Planctomycetota bacterium]